MKISNLNNINFSAIRGYAVKTLPNGETEKVPLVIDDAEDKKASVEISRFYLPSNNIAQNKNGFQVIKMVNDKDDEPKKYSASIAQGKINSDNKVIFDEEGYDSIVLTGIDSGSKADISGSGFFSIDKGKDSVYIEKAENASIELSGVKDFKIGEVSNTILSVSNSSSGDIKKVKSNSKIKLDNGSKAKIESVKDSVINSVFSDFSAENIDNSSVLLQHAQVTIDNVKINSEILANEYNYVKINNLQSGSVLKAHIILNDVKINKSQGSVIFDKYYLPFKPDEEQRSKIEIKTLNADESQPKAVLDLGGYNYPVLAKIENAGPNSQIISTKKENFSIENDNGCEKKITPRIITVIMLIKSKIERDIEMYKIRKEFKDIFNSKEKG